NDGGGIIEAEIHLAKRPKLFRQTEPALNHRISQMLSPDCLLSASRSFVTAALNQEILNASNPFYRSHRDVLGSSSAGG
ncbi:hypothetical protein, partial [Rhizobium leguminosarum]|uniref:hypothetical protein n=1 Tax=Rhizobium leguminosarum TaxID=384 RepID=UPI00197CF97A